MNRKAKQRLSLLFVSTVAGIAFALVFPGNMVGSILLGIVIGMAAAIFGDW